MKDDLKSKKKNQYKSLLVSSEEPKILQEKSYVKQEPHEYISMRKFLVNYLVKVHTAAMIFTFLFIFLQAYHVLGFNLDQEVLKSLGDALILEVIVLFGIIVASMFQKN